MSTFSEEAFREDGGHWFIKSYTCSECGTYWEDEWSCECDDDCPSCGATMEVEDNTDVSEEYRAQYGGPWDDPEALGPCEPTEADLEGHEKQCSRHDGGKCDCELKA